MEENKFTYDIPQFLVEKVEKRVADLNKRAARIGCEPMVITVGSAEYRKVGRFTAEWCEVTIEGEPPSYNGWEFAALIEHSPSGNIVGSKSGRAGKYRTLDNNCDHCGQDRGRTYTVIIQNEDGDEMQVGKTCLKDFMGHSDPNGMAATAEAYFELLEMMRDADYEDDDTFHTGSLGVGILTYITACVMAIDKYGWVSKGSIDEWDCDNRTPTASTAIDIVVDCGIAKDEDSPFKWATEAQIAKAEAVIAHCKAIPMEERLDSDYVSNLFVIFNDKPSLMQRHLGLAASGVSFYDRAVGAERAKALITSEHVGTPKQRIGFTLTLIEANVMGNYGYGVQVWYKFTDENGNVIKWKTKQRDMEIGQTFKGRATIKYHDSWKNVPETIVTNASIKLVDA